MNPFPKNTLEELGKERDSYKKYPTEILVRNNNEYINKKKYTMFIDRKLKLKILILPEIHLSI